MVPVGVLNPTKKGKLVVRAHMNLERSHPRPLAVVHALGLVPIGLTAALPVAFEQRLAAVRQRRELCVTERGRAKTTRDRQSCYPLPSQPPRHPRRPPSAEAARTSPSICSA